MKINIPGSPPPLYLSEEELNFFNKKKPIFNSNIKRVFYPGAFSDFETLDFYLNYTEVSEVFFCDYWAKNDWNEVEANFQIILGREVKLRKIADYYPEKFGLKTWSEFWHPECNLNEYIDNYSFVSEYSIKKHKREIKFYYFGTEAIKTYEILLNLKIKMDIVVCQDHGLGGFWTTFCEGSLLHIIAEQRKLLPDFLMVGCDQAPWSGYSEYIPDFGKFGMHQTARGFYIRQT